jgi:hypothetical protein
MAAEARTFASSRAFTRGTKAAPADVPLSSSLQAATTGKSK